MATIKQKISPCLWFDTQAEDAAKFYTSVFKNSAIKQISRYGKAGQEVHGKEPGSVMVVAFEIEGLTFTVLNGGPHFKFSEAVSFQVMCESQDEIDFFWGKLSAGGQEGQCGWLKDKFGLSWQGRAVRAAADAERRRRRAARPDDERHHDHEKVRSGSTQARSR
jgi:predicted 3-demethylubiquinone-9 3-methyltransferase (glyoxalase superfamily)